MDIIWIIMLITALIIPMLMIILGKIYHRKPPQNINIFSGYRTSMSMKNADTWKFAHQYLGKIWFIMGWISLPLSVIPMFLVINTNADTVALTGGIICILQLIPLLISIALTEKALYKTFNKYGIKKYIDEEK